MTITACSRAAAVQRGLPAPEPSAKAFARQRSSVATLIPTSCDTCSTDELSGGNSLATIRSLYACPYRATFCYPRPQRFQSYLGGNLSDTGGSRADMPRWSRCASWCGSCAPALCGWYSWCRPKSSLSGHHPGRATPSLRDAPTTAYYNINRQRLHLSSAKHCLDEASHLSRSHWRERRCGCFGQRWVGG